MMPPAQKAHMSSVNVSERADGAQPNSSTSGAENTDHP